MRWLEDLIKSGRDPRAVGALRETARTSLASLADHEVGRVIGTVELLDDATTISPLSARVCVAWSMMVERKRLLIKYVGAVTFAVRDASGRRAIITPEDLETVLDISHMRRDSNVYEVNDAARERVEAAPGVLAAELWERTNQRFDFTEGVLKEGDRVSIVGSGVHEPDPDPDTTISPTPTLTNPYRSVAGPTAIRFSRGVVVTNDPTQIS